MDVQYMRLVMGAFATNCYIVADTASGQAFVIDPDGDEACQVLQEKNLSCKGILLTHGHSDHIHGVQSLINTFHAPIYMSEKDAPCLLDPKLNLSAIHGNPITITGYDLITVKQDDEIQEGGLRFKVLETPGHTVGGLCFYSPGLVFAGDTLFRDSVGRTDFPGGDFTQLVQSIQTQLFTLPESTVVYPGHGPETSIQYEKEYNPYVG